MDDCPICGGVAYVVMGRNDKDVFECLECLAFWDAKRPSNRFPVPIQGRVMSRARS